MDKVTIKQSKNPRLCYPRFLFERHHIEVYETFYCQTESKSLAETFVVQLFIDIGEVYPNIDDYSETVKRKVKAINQLHKKYIQ